MHDFVAFLVRLFNVARQLSETVVVIKSRPESTAICATSDVDSRAAMRFLQDQNGNSPASKSFS
jgi:hypothetical protein